MRSATSNLFAAALLVLSLLTLVVEAQIFQHLFGQGGHHQPREQEAPPAGDASWFEARVEAATCTAFLCPRTLSCVALPAQCPCPFPQQVRCPYLDSESEGGYTCITGQDCAAVDKMRTLGSEFRLDSLTK